MSKADLSTSFTENHANVAEDEALELIFASEQRIKELKELKNADVQLNSAKQITKDLNSGYTSATNHEKAKIQFLMEKIEGIRGYEPGSGAKHKEDGEF